MGVCSCAPSAVAPAAVRRPIEPLCPTIPAPRAVEAPAAAVLETPKPRDRRELVVLLHHAYREKSLGHEDGAKLLFKLFVELASPGDEPEVGLGAKKGEVVPARGGVAAIDTPDGPLFFHADTGEPFAFEPGLLLTSEESSRGGQPAHGRPLFSVSVGGDEHSYVVDEGVTVARGRGVAFFDPVAQRLSFQGPTHVYSPRGHLVYAFLFRDCRWHSWDLEKQHEAQALERHLVPAECDDDMKSSYLHDRAVISSTDRWLIADGGVWDLRTRQRVVRYGGLPALSPDERFVAYLTAVVFPGDPEHVRQRNTLVLLDLDSGAVTKTDGSPTRGYEGSYIGGAVYNPDPVAFDPIAREVSVFHTFAPAVNFAVPTLRFLSRANPNLAAAAGVPPLPLWAPPPPRPAPIPRPIVDPALGERLRKEACLVDGFWVPHAYCVNSTRSP